jgi:hypothetical protein
MWSLLSVCPLRPPTDVAVAVKSGWILSMLPPVAAVLGLLYCSNLRPCDMILRTHHDLVDNKQLSAVLEQRT